MTRLPTPGGDSGDWGNILNAFLDISHNPDGTLKDTAVTAAGAADDTTVIHNTTDETIAGIKTFSSSPIVPTPTTANQATNKTYVDSAVSTGAPVTSVAGKTGAVTLTAADASAIPT